MTTAGSSPTLTIGFRAGWSSKMAIICDAKQTKLTQIQFANQNQLIMRAA